MNIIIITMGSNQDFHSYECGFDPYGSIHYRYDIRFYVIALLFLLFDLELVYLYPLILNFTILIDSYINVMIFLLILTIGLIYEYKYSSQ